MQVSAIKFEESRRLQYNYSFGEILGFSINAVARASLVPRITPHYLSDGVQVVSVAMQLDQAETRQDTPFAVFYQFLTARLTATD